MSSAVAPVTPKTVVSLDPIVERWALNAFDSDRTSKQSKIKLKTLDVSIDWSKAKFVTGDPTWLDPKVEKLPNASALYQTSYINSTDQTQEYTMKAERATKLVTTVEVEEGVCKEMEVGLSLKTPFEVLEVNAGFSLETEVKNVESNSTEEDMMWGVETLIKVPRKTKTHAKLRVTENKYDSRYLVTTHAYGKVIVTLTNRAENNEYVTTITGDLVTIVDAEAIPKEKNLLRVDREKYGKPVVEYDTTGKCSFRYGTQQEVEIYEEPLM